MRQIIKQLVMEILSSSSTAFDIKSILFVPAAQIEYKKKKRYEAFTHWRNLTS